MSRCEHLHLTISAQVCHDVIRYKVALALEVELTPNHAAGAAYTAYAIPGKADLEGIEANGVKSGAGGSLGSTGIVV
jgi:hypothetical protein